MISAATVTKPIQRSSHQSALVALCYEHAVLRTRIQAGIRLSPEDQRALKDLSSLLASKEPGSLSLRAFDVSIHAWIETPVVKLAATVVGVSGGGVLLTAWSSIRTGTVVEIGIVGANRTLDLIGTVRWSEPRDGKIALGVEFSPVPISPEPILAARSFRRSA